MSHLQTLATLNNARLAQPPQHTTPRVAMASFGLHAFTERLSSLGKLSGEEVDLLRSLGRFPRSHAPGMEIGVEAKPGMVRIVVSGWACRQRVLGDGRRQILNLILPGDVIGNLEQPELSCEDSLVALTQLVTVDASALVKAIASGDPAFCGLTRAAGLLAQRETALMRDQIVRFGRQTAYERMVHFMLELHARSRLAGTASEDAFPNAADSGCAQRLSWSQHCTCQSDIAADSRRRIAPDWCEAGEDAGSDAHPDRGRLVTGSNRARPAIRVAGPVRPDDAEYC